MALHEARHRLHPQRAGGRGPRPPVHGSGRPGRSVPAGAGPAGQLKPVVAAHEGGAVYMADGYARASGSFGAALGIGGPGCCNMATAVAAAKTDGSPVLVMTGEVPVDMEGRGAFQDASQATLDDTAVMAPLTRLSKTVADSQEPQSLVPPCADHHVGAAARPGAPLADARRADRRMRGGVRQGRAASSPGAQPLSLAPAEAALALLADPQRRQRPHRHPGRRRHRARRRRRAPARRWPSAGRSRSRPRCAPRACSRRITSCRSACSAMPAPAMPPARSSAASSTASSCWARASTSATPCTGRCASARRR